MSRLVPPLVCALALGGALPSALAQDAGAPTDDRCEDACADEGTCRWGGAQCVATSSADCQAASVCTTEGRCTARAGACVLASSADCAQAMACRSSGQCTFADGQCVVGSAADCQRSNNCSEEGECTFADGQCSRTSSADCALSSRCTVEGLCTFDEGTCRAMTDADCQRGTGCTQDGRCTAAEGRCVIATQADCRRAGLCDSLGRCTPEEHEGTNECAAATDAMCRRSEACTRYGHCAAREGRCVPTSDAMCRRSTACREQGACSRLEADGVAYCGPADQAACDRATACRGRQCTRSASLDVGGAFVFGGASERGYTCNPPVEGRAGVLAALGSLGGRPPGIPRLFAMRHRRTIGRDPGGLAALGVLRGDSIGESFGMGGLGLRGTGRGGGGTGEGTIGLGTLGTIGRGGGGGSGAGYGRGAGGLRGRIDAPTVTFGRVESTGALPTEIYQRVVRRHVAEIRFCAEQTPPRATEAVTLRFVVTRSGSVRRPQSTGRVPAALRSCLTRAAGRWAFPTGPSDARVSVPLTVRPPTTTRP